jgi:hypothetical protein
MAAIVVAPQVAAHKSSMRRGPAADGPVAAVDLQVVAHTFQSPPEELTELVPEELTGLEPEATTVQEQEHNLPMVLLVQVEAQTLVPWEQQASIGSSAQEAVEGRTGGLPQIPASS